MDVYCCLENQCTMTQYSHLELIEFITIDPRRPLKWLLVSMRELIQRYQRKGNMTIRLAFVKRLRF